MEIFAAISCTDVDQDGYCDIATGGTDCDDDPLDDPVGCDTCSCGEPACAGCARCIHPGIPEVCDGIDNDCVGGIDQDPVASASCDDALFCNGQEFCDLGACQVRIPAPTMHRSATGRNPVTRRAICACTPGPPAPTTGSSVQASSPVTRRLISASCPEIHARTTGSSVRASSPATKRGTSACNRGDPARLCEFCNGIPDCDEATDVSDP